MTRDGLTNSANCKSSFKWIQDIRWTEDFTWLQGPIHPTFYAFRRFYVAARRTPCAAFRNSKLEKIYMRLNFTRRNSGPDLRELGFKATYLRESDGLVVWIAMITIYKSI